MTVMARAAALICLTLAGSSALAQDVEGVPVTIKVVDPAGKVIPTATIRHPDEEARHRVNTETGEWTDQVLYLPNGDELVFVKGLVLEFEISAPGYTNAHISYEIRKRKNSVPVVLTPMELISSENEEEMEEPTTGFGRSVPRE